MTKFLTEIVGDETLVYDTSSNKAYAIKAPGWKKLKTDRARRLFLAALPAAAFVAITAPTVAEAASCQTQCNRGDFGKQCSRSGNSCDGRCFNRRCL